MTDNLTRIDPKRLEEILQIAPFHRWLGLTLRSCSNEQLELEKIALFNESNSS